MKIGYVVKRYPRFSETFIVNEILAHERAGLQVEIFALLPTDDTHFQNLLSEVRAPVTYLSTKIWKASEFWLQLQSATKWSDGGFAALNEATNMPLRDVAQALELSEQIRNRGVTQLHAHFASAATSVARLASRLSGVPYSFTAHAKDIFHESVDRIELKRKLDDCAAAITVSDFNLCELRAEFGSSAENLRRIYNGLDLRQFDFHLPQRESREILAVGRLVEKKGFGDLISACDLLRYQGVDFHCSIVGTGELEQELRAQIAERLLGKYVEMVGALPQQKVKCLLRSAAVFAAPCVVGQDGNKDGLPTVLLEAMAMGTPCVSTSVTGIPEALVHNRTGLLLEPGNVKGLADSIKRLLDDNELRETMATNARRNIEARFDIERNTIEMRGVFHAVARQNRSQALEIAL
jgi:glycosyltransferase involved in cell wall biosynthesis